MNRRLEAVTVCIGYGDFLAETVKYNAHIFDKWIIVTTKEDKATREVCRRHSLPILITEDGSRDGEFSKGRMIERALQHLAADGWRLHVDADIVLPARTHHLLDAAHLEEDTIYGVDRIMVKNYDDWQKLLASGWMSHDYHCRINFPAGYQVGSRWAHHTNGYCPIGFFQMWHSTQDLYYGTRTKPYPMVHNDACRTDVQHSMQWDRRCRALIPELIAVHLESEPAPLGANWRGRTTKHFGPLPKRNHDRKSYN